MNIADFESVCIKYATLYLKILLRNKDGCFMHFHCNLLQLHGIYFKKGHIYNFLEFRMYHDFTDLFSKLSESLFYKEISKFQEKSTLL